MKKKSFAFLLPMLAMLVFKSSSVMAMNPQTVTLQVGYVDPNDYGNIHRSPIQPPSASISDYTFSLQNSHPDYLVRLVDETNDVVYESFIDSNINTLSFPSTLFGSYQIQLIYGIWMFYGWIELQ